MAKGATTLADVKETEWTDALGSATVGIGLLIGCLVLYYFVQYLPIPLEWKRVMHIGFATAAVVGLAIIGVAAYKSFSVTRQPVILYPCPYCEENNKFLTAPTESFSCESCHRTIHFIDGVAVPVRTIICQACQAEHRVPTNVDRFVCDRCNRPLQISADVTQQMAMAGSDGSEALLLNYNVYIMAVDKRKETELAFKLQNIMVINLPEARRLLGTVSATTPLAVSYNEPQRKAESIRRQLQDLGATAAIRPSDQPVA